MSQPLRTILSTPILLILFLCLASISCKKSESDKNKKNKPEQSMPEQSKETLASLLASINDYNITVSDLQGEINKKSPHIRARYTSHEQKKQLLDQMIRFEVMAQEAFRRGFDKDPKVIRTMKQIMIQQLMKKEFKEKLDPDKIPEEELKTFYKEHFEEYNKPAETRVQAIVLSSKEKAKKIAGEAKGKTSKEFRDMVEKYSEDKESKARKGNLGYFSKDTKKVPTTIVNASFALKKFDELAGPIFDGKDRYYIIKKTGHREAVNKSYDLVKRQIKNRLYRQKRNDSHKEYIKGLREKATVKVDEANLGKVQVDTSKGNTRPGGNRHMHGAPKMPPLPPKTRNKNKQ